MSDVPHQTGTLRNYGLKLVDSLYDLSFYSIVAYSGTVFILAIIATAVSAGVVEVPEFHPK